VYATHLSRDASAFVLENTMALELDDSEKRSFDGPYKIITVKGPLSLFRLCGRTAAGEASNPYGRFWFNEQFFWRMLDVISGCASNQAQLNHYLRFILREFTAVCHDWNTFASVYQLSVPANVPIEVVVGRIAPQPFFSPLDPQGRKSLPHQLLLGGAFQYILDMKSTSEPSRYVHGPRPLWAHVGHA
jgi:hypothetical protein